jgi:hypothetical protein
MTGAPPPDVVLENDSTIIRAADVRVAIAL